VPAVNTTRDCVAYSGGGGGGGGGGRFVYQTVRKGKEIQTVLRCCVFVDLRSVQHVFSGGNELSFNP
jgi:hypothetical protein